MKPGSEGGLVEWGERRLRIGRKRSQADIRKRCEVSGGRVDWESQPGHGTRLEYFKAMQIDLPSTADRRELGARRPPAIRQAGNRFHHHLITSRNHQNVRSPYPFVEDDPSLSTGLARLIGQTQDIRYLGCYPTAEVGTRNPKTPVEVVLMDI